MRLSYPTAFLGIFPKFFPLTFTQDISATSDPCSPGDRTDPKVTGTSGEKVVILLLFSCCAVSDSSRPHGLQHTRLPCPSLSPGVCSKLMSIESMKPSNQLILCRPFSSCP